MKDWKGNTKSTYVTLGASNHSEHERENNDYYATDPKALEILLKRIKQDDITLNNNIWECACGEGHLSKILIENNYNVTSTDLIDRGYGESGQDFLKTDCEFDGDILTNPPYKYAQEFVEHALSAINEGNKVVMFLKIQFLEGQARRKLFNKYPPKYIYVHSERQKCALNGDFESIGSSATCYAWFIWEKGFIGSPTIYWL